MKLYSPSPSPAPLPSSKDLSSDDEVKALESMKLVKAALDKFVAAQNQISAAGEKFSSLAQKMSHQRASGLPRQPISGVRMAVSREDAEELTATENTQKSVLRRA